jgi:hypothetical protein
MHVIPQQGLVEIQGKSTILVPIVEKQLEVAVNMKLGLAGKGKGQAFFSFHVSNDDVIISY